MDWLDVTGRVEPVEIFHCLLLRMVAIELEFQYEAVIATDAVIGYVEPVVNLLWKLLDTHEFTELLFQYDAVIAIEVVIGYVDPVTSLFWNVFDTHEFIELLFQYDAVIA